MLRHLWLLAWRRKGRNLMLTLELMLAFAFLFAVSAFGLRMAQLYDFPLGFDYQDVWSVAVQRAERGKAAPSQYEAVRASVAAMPEVVAAAWMQEAPFSGARGEGRFGRAGGAQVQSDFLEVEAGYQAVGSVKLLQGRWFGAEDLRAGHRAVVLSQAMATQLFGAASPVGQHLVRNVRDGAEAIDYEVVGVMADFRYEGNFMPRRFVMLQQLDLEATSIAPRALVLKMRAGVARSFERELIRRLKQERADWGFSVTPQEEARTNINQHTMIPLTMLAVVSSFLVLMVGGGLFGVLWQHTARRTSEIGLRRALGASPGAIYMQIVGEALLLSTVAILCGTLLLVQLPLTGAFSESLNWPVFWGALGNALAAIYLLSTLCALYPGWRASRLTPTEALHYE